MHFLFLFSFILWAFATFIKRTSSTVLGILNSPAVYPAPIEDLLCGELRF